mmetsp:Transcript_53364/g.173556  ORF Transcript_53364/g.173556 Transcript_53364/m.173556 type:complete len:95 (+) Transcript_53364:238-522(+)
MCHFPHKKNSRLFKGKRDRYRKFLCKVTEQIEKDPESFDLAHLEMPAYFEANGFLKDKFLYKVDGLIASALRRRALDSAGSSASAVRGPTKMSL